ncbi:UNVERIFIED_CONTAM: DEAD-box ATP-dependent RNA helicase FANCM [Sesamum radiatum]|uniref:DEAD-box ATP-dependent RNA helicase FANCM n=1 Tax=Sesamum radiatum TaxID=300843 RepID=A0AAW2M5J1_SESRA
MAYSSNSLHVIDDDDEFDWEAAAQEIDVACQATAAEKPTSISNISSNLKCNLECPPQEMRKKGKIDVNFNSLSSTRQSTLDRFIGVSSSNSGKFMGKVEFSKPVDGNNGNSNIIDDKDDGSGAEFEDVEMLNGFVKIDTGAAKTWIYPVNVPRRDYQFSITRTALFSNTLVVLPTGLGKTLIAAAVMYNFFRWFPEGKIVFAAPSRPLVMQQIEACHKIVGIPQEWTIDLTGQTNPTRRADFGKNKRVFFVTPQVLEKDIQSGSCLVKHLVCLVIDEAHRAMGNYSYCVAVRELMDTPVQLRILALTATPGCKQQTIQHIIDNLQISTLEYRNETDPDVLPYVNERKIELIELSPCDLLNSRDKFRQEPPMGLHHTKYGEIEGYFGVLITLYHVRKLLSSHGIRPAFEMLDEKLKQGDILNALTNIGEFVKATEFIGQSSGKTLKGQSQKVQQAVLQKFRTGGYNVIVATSIGEEGLDIMEVDLVVPHFFKPQVQFLEMSIEEFVPRGKKVKDDNPVSLPAYKTKLTVAETDLLAKYFASTGEIAWRPSLIAFPHFQAFPSPVNKVVQSGLVIMLREKLKTEELETDRELQKIAKDMHIEDFHKQKPCLHTFLFASEFVSVDDNGNVLVLSLPQLPVESNSKHIDGSSMASVCHLMLESEDHEENTVQAKDNPSLHLRSPEVQILVDARLCNPDMQNGKLLSGAEEILYTPVSGRMPKKMDLYGEDPNIVHDRKLMPSADESSKDFEDSELSPRLTNLIKSGIVPESPVNDSGTWNDDRGGDFTGPAFVSFPNLQTEVFMNSSKHDAEQFEMTVRGKWMSRVRMIMKCKHLNFSGRIMHQKHAHHLFQLLKKCKLLLLDCRRQAPAKTGSLTLE